MMQCIMCNGAGMGCATVVLACDDVRSLLWNGLAVMLCEVVLSVQGA
jgi:hypothetical protein